MKGEKNDVVHAFGCDNWTLGQRKRDEAKKNPPSASGDQDDKAD